MFPRPHNALPRRRIRPLSYAAAVLLGLATLAFAPPAANAAITGATLLNSHAQRCMNAPSSTDGTHVTIADCNGSANQKFTSTAASEITVTVSGVVKCLDANGGATGNGTHIILWPCHGGADQKFTLSGANSVTNTKSGRCLDIYGSATAAGTEVVLWDCKTGGNGSQTWTPNGTPTTPPPPPPGTFVVSSAQFNSMFPSRIAFYTYAGLTDAMKKYPAFANTGSDTVKKQEAAAFLANISHESGGLVYVEETNQANWPVYCDLSQPYGCPAGQSAYHGRGPIQLSWNFNYYAAGNALGIDLLHSPDLVKTNGSIAWQTALWYWMTQKGPGTMTAHAAMTNNAGFGQTIWAINGSLECNGRNPAQVAHRVALYQQFSGVLGVSPGGNLSC